MKKIGILFLASFISFQTFAEDSNSHSPEKSEQELKKEEEEKDALPPPEAKVAEKKDLFNLSYYEPLYILLGNPSSKVQLSFKYQFLRNFPMYLGYTQRIFWLLQKESKPFEDANYNPRLFYRLYVNKDEDDDKYIDFFPFEHNSNGKAEPESRSYNAAGALAHWRFEYHDWAFRTHFKAQYRYSLDETNKDIEEFLGPFEAGLAITKFSLAVLDRAELGYRVYTGGKWGQRYDRISHEIGLSFRFFGSELTPAFYFQYFNGYSESLLNYNKRQSNFRLGIIL